MDRHLAEWRHAVDRFWQAEGPDWTEITHVVAGIAAVADAPNLRHAATQAYAARLIERNDFNFGTAEVDADSHGSPRSVAIA